MEKLHLPGHFYRKIVNVNKAEEFVDRIVLLRAAGRLSPPSLHRAQPAISKDVEQIFRSLIWRGTKLLAC